MAIKADGNNVEVFVDEVKNVSSRVNPTSNAPTALGADRGVRNLADNMDDARTKLNEAFDKGKLSGLTRAQFDAAVQKLTSGDITVRFIGSGRTQFSEQLLRSRVGSNFTTVTGNVPRITFGTF